VRSPSEQLTGATDASVFKDSLWSSAYAKKAMPNTRLATINSKKFFTANIIFFMACPPLRFFVNYRDIKPRFFIYTPGGELQISCHWIEI